MTLSLNELASRIGASVVGDGSRKVHRCAPIDRAGAEDLTFVANRKYIRHLSSLKAAAVLIHPDVESPGGVTRLEAEDPYFAFRNAMVELHGFRSHPSPIDSDAISALATIHESARVAPDAIVHPHVTVEAGASVGARTVLYPGVYVGPAASVGDDCLIFPNVTIYDRCIVGNRVTLHASTVIGQDGFGYATHDGAHHKIPQEGIVEIEDDVELGAGCAIERATMGTTRIGRGSKFADLISIGHGATIGSHCLFVSLVGVAGSADVGNYVVLGGQVGVSGHLKIGDGVQAMAKSGIASDIEAGKKVGGVPAVAADLAKRNALVATDLAGMLKRVRELEQRLAELEQGAQATP